MESNKPFQSQGMRLLQQLFRGHNKRIFNIEDATKAATLEKIPLEQLNKILSNLAKQRKIQRLRRGIYANMGVLPEGVHPFVISAYLIQPSAISHWSALQYHGLTEQIPIIISASTPSQVITPSMREEEPQELKHAWKINNTRFEYHHTTKEHYFGLEEIWLSEHFHVSITDKERTLLDVFIYPKLFGGMGGALEILENCLSSIDIKKLIDYAIQYNKKSVIKRLGWSLEHFGVSAQQLEPLLNAPISYYCQLDPSAAKIGPCDNRWMIQNNLTKIKNE